MAMQQMTARPPGPERAELAARAKEIREDAARFFVDMTQRYGDLVYWKSGLQHYFLVNHPDYVKDILVTNHRKFHKGHAQGDLAQIFGQGLVTSEGEVHRRERRLMQPFFRYDRIAESFAGVMTQYVVELRDRWEDGQELDVDKEIMELMLRIVAKVLFDTDVQRSELLEFGDALATTLRVFHVPIASPLSEVKSREGLQFQAAMERMDSMIYRIIEEHRRGGEDRGDLLSMLLQVRDEDGEPMSDLWLRDHTMTTLGAGHDTTSNGIVWTIYLLSQHPDVAARLQGEIDAALGGRPPTSADLPNLPYTHMVMKEGWRIYPPVWNFERRAIADHEVGGYPMPAGSLVSMSQFAMSRNERWYPDALRYDPERWTPEAEASRPKYTYFPFAAGPRVCLGEFLARIETPIVLAALFQEWEFRLVPGHPVELFAAVSLRPKHGMRMTVHRRRTAAA